ncbi:uncharacterized protein PITG_01486 [Phytophthora infestans T30-4]|uniref:Uncharacterized protein n=1 Tax=Phytophthora infestans (strain T30-4) TaxID=403677 RepID=D0MTD3_PHYIT|nr:uncharacterized protein PITG_01486 [Phytophthora infestans T30-4]EEY61230.1 conserved hypothetical protein [Phytophthora infestans T30-4]|eukprot:XP_002908147.1 conserved hypothetical protein [Phytophthora infestans T30-4]
MHKSDPGFNHANHLGSANQISPFDPLQPMTPQGTLATHQPRAPGTCLELVNCPKLEMIIDLGSKRHAESNVQAQEKFSASMEAKVEIMKDQIGLPKSRQRLQQEQTLHTMLNELSAVTPTSSDHAAFLKSRLSILLRRLNELADTTVLPQSQREDASATYVSVGQSTTISPSMAGTIAISDLDIQINS